VQRSRGAEIIRHERQRRRHAKTLHKLSVISAQQSARYFLLNQSTNQLFPYSTASPIEALPREVILVVILLWGNRLNGLRITDYDPQATTY